MEEQNEERMSGDESENSSDSEQESSASSDDDNDKTDEVVDKRILELRDMISNDPYNYSQHVELINLLSKQDDYEQLQSAREHMSSIFPLTEELWLDWLKDEVKYSETTDRQKIMQLFQRAVKDYTSVNVWLEYVQYTIGGMGEEGGLNVIRDTFELALTAAGIHVTQGSLLWDAYREFEMAVFAGLQPLPGSIPDVDSVNKSEAQMSRINKLFQRQLTIPLQGMENTYQEYKDWIGDEIDKETNRKYGKALSKLKELMPFENELVVGTKLLQMSSEAPHLDAYNSYIDFEIKSGDPVRVISIFERAICENCLQPELWLRYTKYVEEHLHNRGEVIKIYERAIRNCPWSVNVWIGYMRLLELTSQQHQLIVDVFSRALASGFSSGSEYLALWTCYLDYLRRRIRWSADHEKELEALRIAFQQALNDLTRRFPADGDQCCTLTQYWALIEAKFCHNMSKARELWSSILQLGYSSQAQMCMEYVRLERAYGDQKHCRKLFQRILTSVSDWPELVTEAYINFEREEGDLEGYMEAVRKCEIQMKLVNERREKEAETEAKLAEQKKAERMEKKKQTKGKQPQQQQKQHYQSDKLSHGKWAKDASEQKTITEIKPYKSKRAAADTQSTIGEVSANANSSVASSSTAVECIQQSNEPTVYVRGQKRKISDAESACATESSAETPPQSSSLQSATAFKVPPPPGFKWPPPPGFKGPPPGYKPKSDPQSADVAMSSSFNADTAESPAKRIKVLESDASTTQPSGGSYKDDCTAFVSNLDYSVTREQLRDIFSKVGEVVEIRIISNYKGRSKGYAYVQFNNELNVNEALKMDRQLVEGRPMFVSPCNRNASEPKLKFNAGLEKNKLFVRGLPLTMTSDELEQLFAEHGKVKEVRLVTYRNGTPKGLAYVEYQNETSAAQAVLKVDGLKIGDNTLSVAISNPPARNAPTSTNREQLQTFVPSLGGGKKDTERGHARTQLMLVPRNVQQQQQRSQQTTTPRNDVNVQSGLDSKTASIETTGTETSTGMSNADFRNMLFKR